MTAVAWFHQPDKPAPTLPKPDVPPSPALKKPDEGVRLLFPNPGAAGILMIGTVLGGTVMFIATVNGNGSIVKPPGKMVIGSNTPAPVIVNGMAFWGIDKPFGNNVNAGNPP